MRRPKLNRRRIHPAPRRFPRCRASQLRLIGRPKLAVHRPPCLPPGSLEQLVRLASPETHPVLVLSSPSSLLDSAISAPAPRPASRPGRAEVAVFWHRASPVLRPRSGIIEAPGADPAPSPTASSSRPGTSPRAMAAFSSSAWKRRQDGAFSVQRMLTFSAWRLALGHFAFRSAIHLAMSSSVSSVIPVPSMKNWSRSRQPCLADTDRTHTLALGCTLLFLASLHRLTVREQQMSVSFMDRDILLGAHELAARH